MRRRFVDIRLDVDELPTLAQRNEHTEQFGIAQTLILGSILYYREMIMKMKKEKKIKKKFVVIYFTVAWMRFLVSILVLSLFFTLLIHTE